MNQEQKFGKFIVIEGGDGAGKTSVVNHLKENFSLDWVFTREPGGNELSDKIRSVILDPVSENASADTLFLLFWASRVANLEKIVWPAIRSGKNVICDRFDASTFAYQIRGQKNSHLVSLFERFRHDFVSMLAPSFYIYLDVDPKVGKERALASRCQDTNFFDEKDLEFYRRVREGYMEFFRSYTSGRYIIIDANKSLSEVLTKVLCVVGDSID